MLDVGLGLIGGSMAKSIKATAQTVSGAQGSPHKETMTMARMCGAIDGPRQRSACSNAT